jgi:hypothetical protein
MGLMKPSTDREAITLILEGLEAKGCKVTQVADDTWNPDELTTVNSVSEAVDLVTGVDEAVVYLDLPEGAERDQTFAFFVLGNDPEEVLNDHGVSLSPYVDPIVEPWWS